MIPAVAELLTSFYPTGGTTSSSAKAGWSRVLGARKRAAAIIPEAFELRRQAARLLTPGGLSPGLVLSACILTMAVVVLFDLVTADETRLQILYVFPLAAIALHCERLGTVLAGLALAISFQLWDFFNQDFEIGTFVADGFITVASSVLTVAFACPLLDLPVFGHVEHSEHAGVVGRHVFGKPARKQVGQLRRGPPLAISDARERSRYLFQKSVVGEAMPFVLKAGRVWSSLRCASLSA